MALLSSAKRLGPIHEAILSNANVHSHFHHTGGENVSSMTWRGHPCIKHLLGLGKIPGDVFSGVAIRVTLSLKSVNHVGAIGATVRETHLQERLINRMKSCDLGQGMAQSQRLQFVFLACGVDVVEHLLSVLGDSAVWNLYGHKCGVCELCSHCWHDREDWKQV